MSEYLHDVIIRSDADTLFAYLADVANLPDYFAGVRAAQLSAPGEVHVVGEVEGVRCEGVAWFETNRASKILRWGSKGPKHYRGQLAVTPAVERGASAVTVVLRIERADCPQARAGLVRTLAEVKRRVEEPDTEPAT